MLRQDPALEAGATVPEAGARPVEEARKTVTVLVADLHVGDGDPEARREGLQRLRGQAEAVVAAHGGTVGRTATTACWRSSACRSRTRTTRCAPFALRATFVTSTSLGVRPSRRAT